VPTPRWERFEAFLWETTSLLVVGEAESLVVDPAITADEVAAIDSSATELGAPVGQLLITHGDWDHVCGIGGFPEATVAMGEETAAKVTSGAAANSVQRGVDGYGFDVAGPPRVDRPFARGTAVALGEFVVESFPLVGHTPDGTGFRLRELGLLIVGDHLSPVEFPFATSPAAYRLTLAGLIELLREDPPETVIPGHGPPHSAEEALGIAQADLGYLRSLHRSVVDVLSRGGTRAEAREAGLVVALPRESSPDLEEMRGFNVDRELDEILPAAAGA